MKNKKINMPLIIILSIVVFLIFAVFIKNVHPNVFLDLAEKGEIESALIIGSTAFFLYKSPLPYRSNLKAVPNLSDLSLSGSATKIIGFFILVIALLAILGFILSKTLKNNRSPITSLIVIGSTLFLLSLGSKYINSSITLDSKTFNSIIEDRVPNAYIINEETVSMIVKEDKNLAYITKNTGDLKLESLVQIREVEDKGALKKLSDFSKTPRGVTLMLLICGAFMYAIRTFKSFTAEMTGLSQLVQINMDDYIYSPKEEERLSFEDIIGYDSEKARLISRSEGKERNIRSILIQGPKGIGKTTFGKAFLNEFQNVHYIPAHKLITHYTGGGNQILDLLFTNENSDEEVKVIFIDDLDLLNEKQFIILEGSTDEDIISNLKKYMGELKKRNIILVVSAENLSKLFDTSLKSKDFDLNLKLDYPSQEDIKKISQEFLQELKVELNMDLDSFVRNNSKKTPLELKSLIYKKSLEEVNQDER